MSMELVRVKRLMLLTLPSESARNMQHDYDFPINFHSKYNPDNI